MSAAGRVLSNLNESVAAPMQTSSAERSYDPAVGPLPVNERDRLAVLRSFNVLDSGYDEGVDNLTRNIVQQAFDVPIVLVSLLDEDRHGSKVFSQNQGGKKYLHVKEQTQF